MIKKIIKNANGITVFNRKFVYDEDYFRSKKVGLEARKLNVRMSQDFF